MNSLRKNSLFNAVYQVLNILFPLISSMYTAQILLPNGVGRVAYAQNIAAYFVSAAALGIPTVGIRAISAARGDQGRKNKVFSELIVINAVSTSVAIICYIIVIFLSPVFRADLQLYLATGLVIAFNYINIDWLYQGLEEYVYIVIRNIAVKILSLIALFLFVKNVEDYVFYAMISSVATCGNYIFNVLRARKYVSLQLRGLDIKQHIEPTFYFAVTIFLSAVYGKVDTTMLGWMVGEDSVGYYAYAHKVLMIGISFCSAITYAFLPRLNHYFLKDKDQFYALVRRGIQLVAFLSIPAAIGLFLLAPDAIQLLFGTAFLPAARTLRIFSVLIIVFAFGNLMCYQMMLCSGSEKMHVVVLAFAAAMNIVLNAVLIPRMQENGAAIASVCTEGFINTFEAIYFARKLKIKYDGHVIYQAILSAGVMGLSILLAKFFIHNSLWAFIVSIMVGIVVYAIMNVLMKNRFLWELLQLFKRKHGA